MARSHALIRLILTASVLTACGLGRPAQLAAQSGDPATWVGDVEVLLQAMDSIHPNPYRVNPREEWVAAVRTLERRLPSLRYHEAVSGFAQLVALAADGHTRLGNVTLEEHTRVALDLQPGEGFDMMFPVVFEAFADGLHVVETTAAYTGLFGKRIAALNGRPTAEVIELLRPAISADNDMWLVYLATQFLRNPAILHAAGVLPRLDADLELTLDDGTAISVDAVPVRSAITWIDADEYLGATAPLPLYRRLTENYRLEYLESSATAYVRYRQVQDRDDETLAQFAELLFAFVDSADVSRLVIDVRRNGGGNNYLNQPLVHGLICSRLNRPGGLFVIIDRGTFSAAISFVAEVERNTHALFVGEPTGAPANHYGDSRGVTLPASGLDVRISTLYWQHADPRDPRPWLVPDIPAVPTAADYLARRDPALAAILAYEHPADARTRAPNRNWRRPSQVQGWTQTIAW
jgi:hypothetical protein